MRWAWLLLVAGCVPPGYRSPGDSARLERAISDENVATRVRMALAEDAQTANHAVTVRCEDGVVTLEGEIAPSRVRDRAVDLAAGCEGVRRVVDAFTYPTMPDAPR